MASIESRYATDVRLADAPEHNLIPNPSAAVDLTGFTNVNCTIARQAPFGGTPASPSGTALRINASASPASFVHFGDTGGMRLGLEAGKTYTLRGSFFVDAALTGSVDQYARRLVAYTRVGTAAYVQYPSPAAANTPGTTNVSVTFTVPDDATEAFIRIFHGHTGGSCYWHSLKLAEGTDASFWDGSTYAYPSMGNPEYGWDGIPGKSTSWKIPAGGTELVDAEFDVLSLDRHRSPFVEATLSMPYPGDEMFARLDPRTADAPVLFYNSQHFTRGAGGELDAYVSHAPAITQAVHDGRGKLWVRELDHDVVADRLTIRAKGAEVVLEDKRRISAATVDTGATSIDELVEYALTDTGFRAQLGFVDANATGALPAGDRRLWLAGETLAELYEPELAGTSSPTRVYGNDVGQFDVLPLDAPPGYSGTYVHELTTGDAGNVVEAGRSASREEWHDATLLKAEYIDGAGTRQVAWQRDPATGVNTRGQLVSIGRPITSASLAAVYTSVADRAGARWRIVAAADFRCRPGRLASIVLATGGTYTLQPDSVTYRIRDGLMEIEGFQA